MNALTLQLLEWVAEKPRSYADAMEAWKSHCPRLTIWEDALHDGLIAVEKAESQSKVVLTPLGSELLSKGSTDAVSR